MKHTLHLRLQSRYLAIHVSSFLLTLLPVLGPLQGEAEIATSAKALRIDQMVSRYEQCGYLNGAVLVAERGKIIYAKGVGDADMELHRPNTTQTRFGIASITKQFTAVLVLKQVAEGNLRLDGTVSEYLHWYRKDTGQRMTVEQLLHHTSGLPPDYDRPEFSDSAEACRRYEPKVFAEKFCQPDLMCKPGTKWAYSNSGYILLGLILENATGKSFNDLLNEQILIPLGMRNTGLCHSELPEHGLAIGYTRHAGPRYTPGPHLDMNHSFSAGAMYSTVEDLFVWNQALSVNVLLTPELRDQVFRPGMNNWAYGWFVTRIAAEAPGAVGTLAEMRGDMPGNFFAWILRYPERGGAIIVLRNGYGSTEHLEEKLQAILFDQQPLLPARNAKDVLAHAWWTTSAALNSHLLFASFSIALSVGALWLASRRRWVSRPEPT
jgi:CubicO group peptidase (beta-lactamase class C family)